MSQTRFYRRKSTVYRHSDGGLKATEVPKTLSAQDSARALPPSALTQLETQNSPLTFGTLALHGDFRCFTMFVRVAKLRAA